MFKYGENYTRTTYNNEEVPEDFKGNTSIENDDQKGSIDEADDQPFMENRQKILDDRVENEESSHVGAAFPRIFSPYGCGPSASPGIFFPDGCGSNGEDKSVNESDNKDEEHVCAPNDLKECKLEGQQDKILEVLYEDLNDAHEVSVDDKDEYNDVIYCFFCSLFWVGLSGPSLLSVEIYPLP